MLKETLLLWLSTRHLPTEAKAVGAFLIWSADERSWRVKGVPVRTVAEFTGYPAAKVETVIGDLIEYDVVADGEVRNHAINCQLNVLYMAQNCGIRLAEAGYRAEYDIVSGYVEALSPEMERTMETVIPFPGRS